MQYTSTVFSKPIRFVFSQVYRPDRKVETFPTAQPYFPVSFPINQCAQRHTNELSIGHSWSRSFRWRTGCDACRRGIIQVYLLYIFLALVSLLTFLRFEK